MAFIVDPTVIDIALGARADGVTVAAQNSSPQYRLFLPANTTMKVAAAMRSGDTTLGDMEIDAAVTGPFTSDGTEPVPTNTSETTWHYQHNYRDTTPGAEVWVLVYPAVNYDRTVYIVVANYNASVDAVVDLAFGARLDARADVTFSQQIIDDLAVGGFTPPVAVAAVVNSDYASTMTVLRSDGALFTAGGTLPRTTGARQIVGDVFANSQGVVYSDGTVSYLTGTFDARSLTDDAGTDPVTDVSYVIRPFNTSFSGFALSVRGDGGAAFISPASYSVCYQIAGYPYTDQIAEYWYVAPDTAMIRTRSGTAGCVGTLLGSALDSRLRALGTAEQTFAAGNAYFVLTTDGVLNYDYDTGAAQNSVFAGTPSTTTGVNRIFPVVTTSGDTAVVVLKTDGTITGYGTGYSAFAVPSIYNSDIVWFATTGSNTVLVKADGSITEYGSTTGVLPPVTGAFRASVSHGSNVLFVFTSNGLVARNDSIDLTPGVPAEVRWPQAAAPFWADFVGCRELT